MQTIVMNQYGNVDIREGLPSGLTHIPKTLYGNIRVKQICTDKAIPYAPAFVGFEGSKRRGWTPMLDGIVIRVQHRRRLLAAIARREKSLDERKAAKPRNYVPVFVKKYGTPDNALLDAAHAMFNLNRFCKHDRCTAMERSDIYTLKNCFIRFLYDHGKCIRAYRHHQDLEEKLCRACDGFGCERCEFSGIYKERTSLVYYVFTFDINGTLYTWHQPAECVSFPVTLSEGDRVMSEVCSKPLLHEGHNFQKSKAQALVRWVIDESAAKAKENTAT